MDPKPTTTVPLISTTELAHHTRKSRTYYYENADTIPGVYLVGGALRWDLAIVLAFLRDQALTVGAARARRRREAKQRRLRRSQRAAAATKRATKVADRMEAKAR